MRQSGPFSNDESQVRWLSIEHMADFLLVSAEAFPA